MSKPIDPRPGRRKFLFLALLFFAPLGAAIALYYYLPQSWQPQGRTNHGHLVTPARPLDPVRLQDLQGQPLDAGLFQGKWTLLYIGGADCDKPCQNTLYLSRQVRTSLGRNMDRVQRVYISVGRRSDMKALTALAETEHPGMKLAVAEGGDAAQFVGFFSLDGKLKPETDGNVYLLDPLGNWLMYYMPQDPARGMLDDLKKLLRLSSVG